MAHPRTAYTDRARSLLSLAEGYAQKAHLDEVTPSHILLALATGDRGVARAVLEKLGIDLSLLVDQIIVPAVQPARFSYRAFLPLDAASTHLLAFGKEEAKRMNHRYFGSEHLLLGMLRMPNEEVCQFLNGKGAEICAARSALDALLNRSPEAQGDGA